MTFEDGIILTSFPSVNMAVGKQGVGKSTLLKRIAEDQFLMKNCVIDLADFGRHENACYALANTHIWIYDRYNTINRTHDLAWKDRIFKPREFPTVVYVPAVAGIPDKLPSIFQPFRIAFQDLEFDEFIMLCGFRGDEVACELLEIAWSSRKSDELFEDFIKRSILLAGYGSMVVTITEWKFEVNTAERRSFAPLLRRLKRLLDSSLICNTGDSLAINLDAIMRDNSQIHCFSMAYIDDVSIPYLIYGFILRKIYSLRLRAAERYHNLVLVIREAQKLAPFSIKFSGQEISRSALAGIARECRDIKTWVFMDTQDPRSMDWEIRGSVIYTWFIFRSDKIVISWLRELFDIPQFIAEQLPRRDVGICAIRFDEVRNVCLAPPPLSLIKSYSEQFIVLWDQFKGDYKEWNIEFSDSNKLIQFDIPDKPGDEISGKELSQYERHIRTWMVHIETQGPTDLDYLCKLVGITSKTAYTHITKLESFKTYLLLNNGIVTRTIV